MNMADHEFLCDIIRLHMDYNTIRTTYGSATPL